LIERFTLHFEIFALILAVFGIIAISKSSEKENEFKINKNMGYLIIILGIFIVLLTRIIPYINNSIPLGYDTGIYKYGIEHGLANLDTWILSGGFEPGFLYFMKIFSLFLSTEFILTYLLVFFCLVLGVAIYFCTKEYFGKDTALISILIYSISLIQFKTFGYMYYKNIIGLSLMLFCIYFLKKSETKKVFLYIFIVLGGILGAIHRPTFYIFGLSYFVYAFTSPYKQKKYDIKKLKLNIISGVLIIVITGVFYIGKFNVAITSMIFPVIQGFSNQGVAGGTFISFFQYQFLTLVYLAFAILGFFILIKKKEFNILFFWTVINASIVYFQFFFFNRFIIHLDVVLIILASLGFSEIIKHKRKLGIFVLVVLIISGGILIFKDSISAKPLINNNELNTIEHLNATEPDSFVMATSSIYSPWVLGYSGRRTIAPGLFDYNKQNEQQWFMFWDSNNISYIKDFMDAYQKPLYVFIGEQQKDNLGNFSQCFKVFYEQGNNKIYQYVC